MAKSLGPAKPRFRPSLLAAHSSKHAPQQPAQRGEVTPRNVSREKGQIDVVGRHEAVGGVIEALFRTAVLGLVEG